MHLKVRVVLAAIVLAAAVAPHTVQAGGGEFDPTFFKGGLERFNYAMTGIPFAFGPISQIAVRKDHDVLVLERLAGRISILRGDGRGGATSWYKLPPGINANLIAADGRNGLFHAGSIGTIASQPCFVGRLDSKGTPDESWIAFRSVAFKEPCYGTSLIPQADGGVILAGNAIREGFMSGSPPREAFLARWRADGELDTAFGKDGIANVFVGEGTTIMGAATQSGGRVLALAVTYAGSWSLLRFLPDGKADAAFGTGGRIELGGYAGYSAQAFAVAPDDKVYIGAKPAIWARPVIERRFADGKPDHSFGSQGLVILPVDTKEYVETLGVQADGKVVALMNVSADLQGEIKLARLNQGGMLDTDFGVQGLVRRAITDNQVAVNGVAIQDDGKILVHGETQRFGKGVEVFVARLQSGAEQPGLVVEFYNTDLDHYFMTASLDDQRVVDSGGAGPGWVRTGLTFDSGGPVRVCRFYYKQSHFFSAERSEECGMLRASSEWQFESYDFSAFPRLQGGACAAGQRPVYRAYSNRLNDPNHRHTTELSVYQAQIAKGWIGEGVVMCVPN